MSKNYPLLRKIIEEEVQAVTMINIVHHEKMGKIGAMKAHKRLIESSQKEIKKYKEITKELIFMPTIPLRLKQK